MDKVVATTKYNKILPTKLSSTTLLTIYVLHALKENNNIPIYGNEILKKIENKLGGTWSPSHGTLYPLLNDLEKQKLIKVIGNDNKRKFYIMTPEGSKVLSEKLKEYESIIISSKLFFDNLINSFYGSEVSG